MQRVAARLQRDHGLRKGDRLGLLTLGCPEYVIAYLATVSLGAIAVPVNLGLTAEGLAAQIDKVKARLLVVSPELWAGKLEAVRARLPSVQAVFMTGDQAATGHAALCRLNRDGAEAPVHESIDEWDVCAISFTSGTTGVPKGTMAMHINAIGCAQQHRAWPPRGWTSDDINICMPPLYHNTAVYTDFMPALLTGGKCVVMSAFAPLEAIELVERERCTWAVAAPIMLWMMMNHPRLRASTIARTLKKILFGGHAASETFINQLKACFDPVAMVNGGSVSESTALGFALPTEDAIRKITSCGLATPNYRHRHLRRRRPRGDHAQRHRRGRLPRPADQCRLLGRAGQDRRGLPQGRLRAQRRLGQDRRGGLPLAARPQEGHGGARRPERLLHRGREQAVPAPGRAARGGGRRARPCVQRAAEGGAGAQARPQR